MKGFDADPATLNLLVGIRDNGYYTDEYRGRVAAHHGFESWQHMMDLGLAEAELHVRNHCGECGRPYASGTGE